MKPKVKSRSGLGSRRQIFVSVLLSVLISAAFTMRHGRVLQQENTRLRREVMEQAVQSFLDREQIRLLQHELHDRKITNFRPLSSTGRAPVL